MKMRFFLSCLGFFASAAFFPLWAADPAHAAGHAGPFWTNTSFWVSLGGLCVIGGLFFAGVHRKLADAARKHRSKVEKEIIEARRLREEAQLLLTQSRKDLENASAHAEHIIEQARHDIAAHKKEAEQEIEKMIAIQQKEVQRRLEHSKREQLHQLRAHAARVIDAVCRDMLKKELDQKTHKRILDATLKQLS